MSNPFAQLTKMQAAVMAFAALAALALPMRHRYGNSRPQAGAAAPSAGAKMPSGGMAMPQTLVCPLWRVSPNLAAKIHIKNALMVAPLAVTPTLYMADGTPYQLPPVELPMSGEVTVDLNQALANAPSWLGGHISDYGSAALTYRWDGAGHVSASMNLKDLVHSLTFHQTFFDLPSSMRMGAGSTAAFNGYQRWQEQREHAVLASYHIPMPVGRQERGTSQAQTPPLDGLWWKRDAGVIGYFALANTSTLPIKVRYRVSGSAGAQGSGAAVGLGPNATAIVPLDPLIASLPPNERGGGGITVEQLSGPAMAMSAAGWMENDREGFSASIEFEPGYMPQPAPRPADTSGSGPNPSAPPPAPASGPVVLAATGLMLGKPMGGAGFPDRVRFRPYGYLRNTSRRPLLVTVTANVAMGTMGVAGTAGTPPVSESFGVMLMPHALVPVALAPLARRLQREMARKMGMDPDAVEGAMLNWSVSFDGGDGEVLMTTGSTDQTGNYVFEVMPVRMSNAVGLQLPYWNTAHGNDTMYSLWNPGGATQNVVLTLYSADGMHSYVVPVTLAPGAAAMVDIGMLRQEGTPDPSGKLLPPEVQDGSAMLEPAAAAQPGPNGKIMQPASGPAQMQVAVNAGIFNPATATCCSQCGYCCFYSCPLVTSASADIGNTLESYFTLEDCCGVENDFSLSASWVSGNTAILTSEGLGQFNTVGAGDTSVFATVAAQNQAASGSYCASGCLDGNFSASNQDIVRPALSSISPTQQLVGTSAGVELDGSGFASGATISVSGNGVSASGVSVVSGTEIDATFALATTADNSVNVSVTVNGQPSGTVAFVPQHPRLSVYYDTSQTITAGCSPNPSYVARFITYNIVDQNGAAISTPIKEVFISGPTTNTCNNGASSPTMCTAPSSFQQLTDELTVGCNSVGGTCGYAVTNQWQTCPTGGTSVPIGTTSWTIQDTSTTITIGSTPYTLPGGNQVPAGTIINP